MLGEDRNMNNYAAVHLQPRNPKEPFIFDREPKGFSLLDFWIWSGSDVLNNTLRGQIAEYIITKATGARLPAIRVEWNSVDVMTPKGHEFHIWCDYISESNIYCNRKYCRIKPGHQTVPAGFRTPGPHESPEP